MPDFIIRGENPAMLEDGTKYHRDDIVKALEAKNKMLAEAVRALAAYEDEVSQYHAEAIALAQQIGEKNVEIIK